MIEPIFTQKLTQKKPDDNPPLSFTFETCLDLKITE